MTIKVDLPIKGRYKMTVLKNGEVQRETGWFDNLITNYGMNSIAESSSWGTYLSVGSGSATPANTDTTLSSRVATSAPNANFESALDTGNCYLIMSKTISFRAGAAAGTLAEVGVGNGSSGTGLFSRALILDSGGSPTTITVLGDEDLVVVYQLWIKQPTGDFTMTVGGKNCTVRACGVGSTSSTQGWSGSTGRTYFSVQSISYGAFYAYTGSIGSITAANPTGSSVAQADVIAMSSYTSDSWTRECKFTFSTAIANDTALKSFVWNFGPTRWQMEMDSTITKTVLQTLRIGVSLSWSRDSGPA